MAKADLTAERLRDLLNYDTETGIFVWKTTRNHLSQAGCRAGYKSKEQGYRKITVFGHEYPEHRLAYLYVTGNWPHGDVDHINGVTDDNRFCNLRDVTTSENCQNQRRVRSDSISKLIGARQFRPGKWQSSIKVNGKYIHLGTFNTPEEAHAAYLEAKRKYHPMNTL